VLTTLLLQHVWLICVTHAHTHTHTHYSDINVLVINLSKTSELVKQTHVYAHVGDRWVIVGGGVRAECRGGVDGGGGVEEGWGLILM